jgi:hypothetical protein
MHLQLDASTMKHSSGTATVSSDSTARHHTADQVQRVGDKTRHAYTVEDIMLLLAINVILYRVLPAPEPLIGP